MGDKRLLIRTANGINHPGVLVAIAVGAGIGMATNFMAQAWVRRKEIETQAPRRAVIVARLFEE